MKKIILVVSLLFIVFIVSGCDFYKYKGNYVDLYTVAVNSILWNNGHSYGADRAVSSEIKIIDKDEYGRTLFTYYEKYYAGAEISFSSLIISQKTESENVYYYEDLNYIIKKQKKYALELEGFTNEEVENLKLQNDWNKEISLNKCIKKQISNYKQDYPKLSKEIKNKIISDVAYEVDYYDIFINFLTDDLNGKFIGYGNIMVEEGKNIYYIFLAKIENEELKEISFLIPTDVYNYKNELIDFKISNNWVY